MILCGTRTCAKRVPFCPCEPCAVARRARSTGHDPATGDLLTECWCQRDALLVPARDVWDGVTRSCGRIGCHP